MYAIRSYYAEVRREYLDVLLGRERRSSVIAELRQVLAIPLTGAPILAAAIQGVLEGMVQKNRITSYNVCYTKLLRFP